MIPLILYSPLLHSYPLFSLFLQRHTFSSLYNHRPNPKLGNDINTKLEIKNLFLSGIDKTAINNQIPECHSYSIDNIFLYSVLVMTNHGKHI